MRAIRIALALLFAAGPATAQFDTQPPPPLRSLTVGAPTAEAAGALFKVTWETVLDPPGSVPVSIYRWTAGFSDGTQPRQGAVADTTLMLRMPYHASGAAPGFVCVLAEDPAGNVSPRPTCAALTVPATPTTTHKVDYSEPTTNAAGQPLGGGGLASIRLYWRVDDGPETVVTLPVSSPKGGLRRRFLLTIPATSGTLSVTLTAVNMGGKESARTAPMTKIITPTASE
jgi:hypothetical protein